jgi:hypothetical protein
MAFGALLTCLAVVLNITAFATAPKRTTTGQTAESMSIAPSQSSAGTRPDRSRSTVEATGISAASPSTEMSAILDDAFANFGLQPVRPKDRDVEMKARQVPQSGAIPEPATQPLATIVGIWAPDAGTCSARFFREGLLPTIINTDGAWAGETFCIFKNQKLIETGWRVVANCSNPHEHWTTEVRLTVKDNRLMWTSKRGTQAYTRCSPDFLMADAH